MGIFLGERPRGRFIWKDFIFFVLDQFTVYIFFNKMSDNKFIKPSFK